MFSDTEHTSYYFMLNLHLQELSVDRVIIISASYTSVEMPTLNYGSQEVTTAASMFNIQSWTADKGDPPDIGQAIEYQVYGL